ncbi:Alpha/Beta hydrolase protein [Aspergillus karnatakaensis]|uniref:Alpha/Beta hydrolase protein n=1 Tax=Aspergillus karnatakaensis TaxID=1810916 RepID=UPI003CCD0087
MRTFITALLALSVGVSATPAGKGHSKAPRAHVKNGTYEGIYSPEYDQEFFLGVPFAQPPVDDLRFRLPQSLNSTWKGTKDAKDYSLLCVGYGLDQTFYNQSEDCLYLNVIRPAGYENTNLPVGFWIHGGGFANGGGGDQRYNLSFIVEQSVKIGKPIIGVSINYRLSLWGFLHSNEVVGEGVTNLGLRDQRLALHWVQENIRAFGGDANKVTIFGESAGAASVGFQLTAYNGRDDALFRGAILQSGNPIFYGAENGTQRSQPGFEAIVSAVGCSDSWNRLQCLREVPFLTLNATMNGTLETGSFGPTIDGDFVRTYRSQQLRNGQFVKVPIITGANSDEGASMGPQGINTTEDFKATLSALLPESFQDAILEAYPDDLSVNVVASLGDQRPAPPYGAQFRRSASFWGDYQFIASRRETAKTWASHGVPAYAYRFNAIPAGVPPEVGAGHYKEIGFMFNNLDGVGYRPDILPFEGKGQNYIDLAALMSSSWVSFIHGLDPNGFERRDAAVPEWPKYDVNDPKDFVFDANVTSFVEADTYRAEGMRLINDNALGVLHR